MWVIKLHGRIIVQFLASFCIEEVLSIEWFSVLLVPHHVIRSHGQFWKLSDLGNVIPDHFEPLKFVEKNVYNFVAGAVTLDGLNL